MSQSSPDVVERFTFGQPVENIAASEDNPTKRGFFVRSSGSMVEYASPLGVHHTPPDNLRASLQPAHSSAEMASALSDDKLAAWARNWHWEDTAHDRPVDPSIYFRDLRMLRAFIAKFGGPRDPAQPPTEAREKEITRLATIEECARIADIWSKEDDDPAEGDWLRGRRYGSEQAGKQIASAIRRMASALPSTDRGHKKDFKDTFSAETVLLDAFFPSTEGK